jgi:hypothetical protein
VSLPRLTYAQDSEQISRAPLIAARRVTCASQGKRVPVSGHVVHERLGLLGRILISRGNGRRPAAATCACHDGRLKAMAITSPTRGSMPFAFDLLLGVAAGWVCVLSIVSEVDPRRFQLHSWPSSRSSRSRRAGATSAIFPSSSIMSSITTSVAARFSPSFSCSPRRLPCNRRIQGAYSDQPKQPHLPVFESFDPNSSRNSSSRSISSR